MELSLFEKPSAVVPRYGWNYLSPRSILRLCQREVISLFEKPSAVASRIGIISLFEKPSAVVPR